MKAWIARDSDRNLYLYYDIPPHKTTSMWDASGQDFRVIDSTQFPQVKWEDEKPTEVDIIIKPKQE